MAPILMEPFGAKNIRSKNIQFENQIENEEQQEIEEKRQKQSNLKPCDTCAPGAKLILSCEKSRNLNRFKFILHAAAEADSE